MRKLPNGTVTFLFTDIEGSTKLLHELGDAYAGVLADHRRALRAAFAAHGGAEVDTQGDAFFVAFGRASDAFAAAAAGQAALSASPIRVRMGLHTGEPIVTDEGYVGIDVHRAARISAAAHGGQVLVSQSTRDLADADELRDLGEHRLKDLSAPERLYQLGGGNFPPLRSLYRTNLPTPPTALVGREREVSRLLELLRGDVRLVTLTGPGGTGKTRLAVEVAHELVDDFSNGVFFVGLAPLLEPALVAPTVAQVLDVKERGGQLLVDLLCEHLGDKHLLLLLDNCEHLLEASPLLSELLAAAPGLMVLATSRERLRLAGEQEFPLAPLAEEKALELFSARARAAQPSFALDGNRAEVAEICRRLDGLPLALELAAARVRVFSSQALLARLEQRLPLLTGGARDVPERHQTLRATIAWSYELLDAREQALFARIAVFAGGCTPEAAEEVCDADLDTIISLVDKSLLRQSGDRFWMLETIREYALERLEDGGEADEIRARHARHFLKLAEQAEDGLRGTEEAMWLERLELEHDNLRAILARRDGDLQLELAGAVWRFWHVRGHFEEGARWLREVLEPGSANRALRAKALHGAANLAMDATDPTLMRECAEEELVLFEGIGDNAGIARALLDAGNAAVMAGDHERAQALFERTRTAAFEAGDRLYLASVTINLGDLALQQGDWSRSFALSVEALDASREQGQPEQIATALANAALASFRLGRFDEAARNCKACLELVRRLGAEAFLANWLIVPAALAVVRGAVEEALSLLSMANARIESGVATIWPAEQKLRDETLRLIQAELNAEQLGRAERTAREASFDEAVAYALRSIEAT
jgi:predicted ATPase/class 3 adenylate cyclase